MSALAEQLVQFLCDLLSAQLSDGKPLIVVSHGARAASIYRPVRPTTPGIPFTESEDSLVLEDYLWRPVMSVSRLLSPFYGRLHPTVGADEWVRVSYLFSVASAITFLARVAGSLEAQLRWPVDRDRLESQSFRSRLALARRRAATVRRFAERIMATVVHCLTVCDGTRDQTEILKLEFENCQTQAVWMARSGKTLSREPLPELVRRNLERQVQRFLDRSSHWSARLESCRHDIEQALGEACPQLAPIILDTSTSRRVGFWLFSGFAQGFPTEGFLYLEPPRSDFHGYATVLCNRAHSEFILQSIGGAYYWFPPCMVSCRVLFERGDQAPVLCRPEMRIPRGFLPMVHPYTGDMIIDSLASFEMLNLDNYSPAMVPVSADLAALRVAPRERSSVAMMRDFCISGQDSRIRTLLAEARDAAGEIQPCGLVEGVWRLAVQGLTRAHELNQSTPRARLESSMYYPVGNPRSIADTPIAARVFPYLP